MDVTDIYRIFYSNTEECTFFSTAPGTLPNIDHMLEHKATLNKCRKIKIADCILSELMLNINRNRNYQKYRVHRH